MDYYDGFVFNLDENNSKWKEYYDNLGKEAIGVYSVAQYFITKLKEACNDKINKVYQEDSTILSSLSNNSLELCEQAIKNWNIVYNDLLQQGEVCAVALCGYSYEGIPQSSYSFMTKIACKEIILTNNITISEYAELVETLFVLRFGKKPQDCKTSTVEFFIPALQFAASKNSKTESSMYDTAQTSIENVLEVPAVPALEETLLEGYFYLRTGVPDREHNKKYKGKSKQVYCVNEIKENYLSSDCVELSYEYDEFRTICNIIKQECTSMDENEFKAVAYASYNHSKVLYKKSNFWLILLNTGYSSVKKTNKIALEDQANDAKSNLARRAVIYVLEGKKDMTDGAEFWDGGDFLAIGLETDPYGNKGQGKFRQYKFIEIPNAVYNSYKSKWSKTTLTYITKVHTKDIIHTPQETHAHTDTRIVYNNPAKVFTDKANRNKNNDFYYETGVNERYGITATLCAGDSIFWKLVTTRTTSKE